MAQKPIIREIKKEDECLSKLAELIKKYSWGIDYPIEPTSELKTAEYVIGVFVDSKLVGGAYIHRNASPDGIGNGEWWLGGAVVRPGFRKKGIFAKLYKKQIDFVKNKKSKIFCCTDNSIVERFLLKHGWQLIRTTKDEGGNESLVFEYVR